jgi:arylsulfatase A-like enzyme
MGNDLRYGLVDRCKETDRPIAALLKDLETRGLLDKTLVVWGGEFGRTPMNELRGGPGTKWIGRDHHQHAFTMWMAGAGVKAGYSHGTTDDLGYHVEDKPVHVHDLQATILHLFGLDHERLTFRFQGRDYRLTDVHGKVVKEVLA